MFPSVRELLERAEVLGSGPFPEVPCPTFAVRSGELLAVVGSVGVTQWGGRDLRIRDRTRVGVYSTDGQRRHAVVALRWPVNDLAFDPTGENLAIASGSYDGGWMFEGELVLVDLRDGSSRSVLADDREVVGAEWVKGGLAITIAPADEEAPREFVRYWLRSQQLDGPPNSIDLNELEVLDTKPMGDGEWSWEATGTDALTALGLQPSGRRQVWDVDVDDDGCVLGALEGVRLERWDATELRYRIGSDGRGCQIERIGTNVVTNVEPRWRPPPVGLERPPSSVEIRDPVDGTLVHPVVTTSQVVVALDAQGGFIARDANFLQGASSEAATIHSAEGTIIGAVQVGGYDLFNHYFRIRDAPYPLVLVGRGTRPSEKKWIAALHPPQTKRRWGRRPQPLRFLFPLEWDEISNRHAFGGPGTYVRDGHGEALVHAGAIHDGRGLLPGNAFVIRRSLRDGRAIWDYRTDSQISALALSADRLLVGTTDGALTILAVSTGDVLDEGPLLIDGWSGVPMSLATSTGWLAIGLADGRLLRSPL